MRGAGLRAEANATGIPRMFFTVPVAFNNSSANMTWGAPSNVSACTTEGLCWFPERNNTKL